MIGWLRRRRVDAGVAHDRPSVAVRPQALPGKPPWIPARPAGEHWEWPAVRVRCGAGWHWMQIGDGHLNALDHTQAEIQREFTLAGLGGPMAGCASVLQIWRTGRGRLPKVLRQQRRDFYLHARYGYTDEVLAMLDDGFDITAPDSEGATLMHYLVHLDHERIWPRLHAAGLSVDARDCQGRTPLERASQCRNEPVWRLLRTAGANIWDPS